MVFLYPNLETKNTAFDPRKISVGGEHLILMMRNPNIERVTYENMCFNINKKSNYKKGHSLQVEKKIVF